MVRVGKTAVLGVNSLSNLRDVIYELCLLLPIAISSSSQLFLDRAKFPKLHKQICNFRFGDHSGQAVLEATPNMLLHQKFR